MEQETQVKAVEEKQETSTQEKEAAVIDNAVKEGEVNPEYGLQSDGVYKVNLDNPPKQKEDAVQEQSTDDSDVVVGEPEDTGDSQEVVEEVRDAQEEEVILEEIKGEVIRAS